MKNARGEDVAIELGGYFQHISGQVEEWTFGSAPEQVRSQFEPFRVPRYPHPFSEWLNLLSDTDFTIERLGEPRPDDEAIARCPAIADARVMPYFLHVRARKA